MIALRRLISAQRHAWRERRGRGGDVPAVAPQAQAAEPHQGSLTELSPRHAAGYLRSLTRPDARSEYEIVLAATGEVLARGRADQFFHGLSALGIGDGAHGFWAKFPRPLSEAERQQVIVRPVAGDVTLSPAPGLLSSYEPVLHVAMDIVDNCNLRCPFCLYDYANTHTTHVMEEATLDAALPFLPYTRDGQFWFSCLHEPTLHPELTRFVDKVPAAYRHKLFFTTNLAKRMRPAYFEWLARSGLHNLNISIESLEPALYERMRKGARHRIFMENWDRLLAAFAPHEAPPRLLYIAMAYKSNLRELPRLVAHLLDERRAWRVQLRYTFPVPHIAPEFAAAEYLDAAEWAWLGEQMAQYPADRVQVVTPPAPPPAPAPDATPDARADAPLPGRYMFRLSWDGSLRVVGVPASSRYENVPDSTVLQTNIRDAGEPEAFLAKLDELCEAAGA